MSENTKRLRGHVASYKIMSPHRQNCLDVCDEVDLLCTEGKIKDDLIKLLVKECAEMEFDHSNTCMNWAYLEHSQIECALCQLREAVSTPQCHHLRTYETSGGTFCKDCPKMWPV